VRRETRHLLDGVRRGNQDHAPIVPILRKRKESAYIVTPKQYQTLANPAMKTIAATMFAIFASLSALAQTPQSSTKQEEVRTISASLKEAYGVLSQDLARLGREIGADATKATPAQAAMRERMQTTLGQLESVLTTVNTVGDDQWTDAKAKAEQVRVRAMAIVEERQKK